MFVFEWKGLKSRVSHFGEEVIITRLKTDEHDNNILENS